MAQQGLRSEFSVEARMVQQLKKNWLSLGSFASADQPFALTH